MTIWKWIIKYSKLAKEFVDSPKLEKISGDWHVRAFKKVFYSRYKEHRVEFVRRAGIRARETNNIVERLHGTLIGRLIVVKGLKSEETAEIILSGWFVFYNFIRSHESLKGKTLAKAVGLDL